ncbi:MAG: Spy/CpxP family protein refolding chaperone [Pseudomonadota bacterium]|nr:Spy/CpxP family protein refolding chaperone [Pseudomonadota bacterium]
MARHHHHHHHRKHLLIATLLAATAGLAGAQTVMPAAGDGAAQPPAARASAERGERGDRGPRGEHARKDPAEMQKRMAERHAKRMADLKAQLKITPAQEGAWNNFAAAMQPKAPAQRPDRAEFDKLTTPQRIDRMQALHAERGAEMKARGDATKAFYAQLTPEQQKTFDERALRGGKHGDGDRRGGGKHGRHGGHHGGHH